MLDQYLSVISLKYIIQIYLKHGELCMDCILGRGCFFMQAVFHLTYFAIKPDNIRIKWLVLEYHIDQFDGDLALQYSLIPNRYIFITFNLSCDLQSMVTHQLKPGGKPLSSPLANSHPVLFTQYHDLQEAFKSIDDLL